MSSSEQRKLDHLHASIAQNPSGSPFADFLLVHRCLPELALKEVDISVNLFGLPWGAPLYINSMTGGHSEAEKINESLGYLAKQFDIPVAVGSQKSALKNPHLRDTYRSIRKHNTSNLVWGNLSAGCTIAEMEAAIEMINADALQLHLNAPQELAMAEGDRDFSGWRSNIHLAAESLKIPVIAKEVGFGMAKEEVSLLAAQPVSAIDIGGAGGTDFLRIEQSRYHTANAPLEQLQWGIPTPISVVEALSATKMPVFASGGVDTPLSACLSLALGASAVGLGRVVLKVLMEQGLVGASDYLTRFIADMRLISALQGCRSVSELATRPVVITGLSYQWLHARGLHPEAYAAKRLS